MTQRRDAAIAALWGFAEAVLWFIVPDVFLTWVAVRKGVRPALWLSAFAVAGAIVGGLFTYGWGATAAGFGETAMAWLPGIDAAMIDRVESEVAASGSAALLDGPRQAQPYKLYALAAGDQGTSVLALVGWTIPGRAFRFVLSSVVAAALGAVGRRLLPQRVVVGLWATFWLVVYAWLWTT
jgi:hypothetical protein